MNFEGDRFLPKKKKGKSHSNRPLGSRSPSWFRYTTDEVESLVVKLAREGNSFSTIGVILRDQYGIPLVRTVVGKSISEIVSQHNINRVLPEDLESLLAKANRMRAHLERYKMDKYNKRSLQIIESKIYKLSKYYKRLGKLEKDWKYDPMILFIR